MRGVADTKVGSHPESILGRAERWLFTMPLAVLALAAVLAARLLYGYHQIRESAMAQVANVAHDPFHQLEPTATWLYQQPVGTMLAWSIGATSPSGIARVHFAVTLIVVVGCSLLVGRWVSDTAARLFVVAWWCSPQSAASVAGLGLFDILTVGGLTVAMIAPTTATCFAVGAFLGFQNFEQAVFALVAVGLFRIRLRHERPGLVLWTFGGLVVGRVILAAYLAASHIPANGRIDFLRDHWGDLSEGYDHGRLLLRLVWAVYNVLWVAIIWQLRQRPKDQIETVALAQLWLTIPVLLTFDLSRVYRNLTWPIVVLVVLWCAEHRDQRIVRRGAVWLVVAACFVPRTELWHAGFVLHQ